ncbi:MAG: hypothetical protein ABIV43_03330 [Candidatus Saccharimonadales bacterium]
MSTAERISLYAAWGASLTTSLLAILVWGRNNQWQLSFDAYVIFPLLGLLAFSLMWSHYLAAFVRRRLGVAPPVLSHYFESTSIVVLGLLFLHPGLLILQRFRDGYGLPPHSYYSYVAPGLGWVTLLGTVSWLAFMAYEFRRIFADKSWWKYIPIAGDVAMLAIAYHGLRLGSQLQTGWYKFVWLSYAVALVFILAYNYFEKFEQHAQTKSPV